MLTIAALQLNVTVGDIEGNIAKITNHYHQAALQGVDLIICPELALTGYPPEDLILMPYFQQAAMKGLEALAKLTVNGPALLVGTIITDGSEDNIYNAACLLEHGIHTHSFLKHHLPNYGVFDEHRLFSAGPLPSVFSFKGLNLAILICEDLWFEDTTQHLAQQKPDLVISINASPYDYQKQSIRLDLARHQAAITGTPIVYVNQLGGQDELVFDGGSFVYDPAYPDHLFTLPYWQDTSCIISFHPYQGKIALHEPLPSMPILQEQESHIYQALLLSLKDYIHKNGFPGVLIGMSGGIDSALSAAIAVDALGADKVRLIMMPSVYTSKESLYDAKLCADALKVPLEVISIEPLVKTYHTTLRKELEKGQSGIAYENIQSRIRGTLLMALSNSSGYMVLTTGNKSEMAVGYATLYGDMCGGFNVLKDLYKTQVYALSHWRNKEHIVIPKNILKKAPSAELRAHQTDQDSLPEYEILDDILELLIEARKSTAEIEQLRPHYARQIIDQVGTLVQRAEYKRRQSAPGVKITPLSFGRDRRFPITSKFKL